MRLPDPFTNPDIAQGFTSARLVDNDPVIRDELPNGAVKEVKVSAQYWGIEITYPDLYPEEFMFLDSFIKECKRTGGYIEVLLPQYEPLRVSGNTSLVTIASGQRGSTIVMTNTSGLRGLPKPGDLFKLTTGTKVYKITSVASTASTMTLTLYPDLFLTTNGSDKPIFNGILFRTKMASGETIDDNINPDGVYTGVSLKLRESL